MPAHLYFNELSIPFANAEHAYSETANFVSILKQAVQCFRTNGQLLHFYRPADFSSRILYDGCSIASWITRLEKNERDLIFSILGRNMTFEDIATDYEVEYIYQSNPVVGLGLAFENAGLGFSFLTKSEWDNDNIQIGQKRINTQGSIEECDVGVQHVSRTTHAQEFYSCPDAEQNFEEVQHAEGIGAFATANFTKLVFGERAFDQCNSTNLDRNSAIMILKSLRKLNQFFADQEPPIRQKVSNVWGQCSFESTATMEQYGHCRDFLFNGKKIRCEEHCKLNYLNWRIHFCGEYASGFALVGYIGPHLPISSD